MTKMRFGVLGCASIARRHVLPAMVGIPDISLVAIASRTREKAVEFAKEFNCRPVTGYEDLLRMAEIDAVYVPLPTGLHCEWARRALDAGKHVLIEKSLGSTLGDATSVVEKARLLGLVVKENYMFEYHAQQAQVRHLISTRIGRAHLFRANFGFPPLPKNDFRYDPALGGGALLDAGGYVLKALKVFFPSYKNRLLAAMLAFGEGGVDVAGAAMVELVSEDHRLPAHLAFGFDHHYQCGIEVWGSRGKLCTDRTFTAGPAVTPTVRIETASGVETFALPTDNHFRRLLINFIGSVHSAGRRLAEYDAIVEQACLQEQVRRLGIGRME
jgi:NDP-hexose-3-ketoreductase